MARLDVAARYVIYVVSAVFLTKTQTQRWYVGLTVEGSEQGRLDWHNGDGKKVWFARCGAVTFVATFQLGLCTLRRALRIEVAQWAKTTREKGIGRVRGGAWPALSANVWFTRHPEEYRHAEQLARTCPDWALDAQAAVAHVLLAAEDCPGTQLEFHLADLCHDCGRPRCRAGWPSCPGPHAPKRLAQAARSAEAALEAEQTRGAGLAALRVARERKKADAAKLRGQSWKRRAKEAASAKRQHRRLDSRAQKSVAKLPLARRPRAEPTP